ncbi:cob(I)yrinic acid a,c-diamide adenosyltransferase [Abyssalbus ytuae]|uniref:Corrinoid adenosyltransferase n=1 Tax=Abyssalbus ytuae TaxID=2926907 RepID=A0A9E6ZZG7_9FLAO|nr:cob(I)yrinic acid a,c-diamide adenosyltransferase [Abyssalbus ytuae]UOB18007.1 cob(I)yrinic acid a,c-diamide adenosyltransferase [Abyssalbus ytuae]
MKIYTKKGDSGTTALYGGTRVSKNNERIDCYGDVDELNSWIGLIRDQDINKNLKTVLIDIQECLFVTGSILATPADKKTLKNGTQRNGMVDINENDVKLLEDEIDRMNDSLPPLTHFILPGGHPIVSYCHIARTVCRRAERKTVKLFENEPFNPSVLKYLNRLSDFLFVLARKLSDFLQAEEIKWIPTR